MTILSAVVVVTLMLVGNGAVLAEDTQSDSCADYLEMVSGLNNLACTPGNLSAILVFAIPEQPQFVQYPGEDMVARQNGS